MSTIDPTSLLQPVSEDAPCGPNMEYDAAFGELERAAQRTPERVIGDRVVAEAEEPDWRRVLELAQELLGQTKDLRIAVHLVNAALRTGGLSQVGHGFAVVRGFLTDYWDAVHPELDREENDDPTLRMNSLLALNDRGGFIGALLRCPLIQSRALGRVTLRDVRIASGELTAGANEPPALEAAHIDAAFMDGELDELEANAAAVRAALAELDQIGSFLDERVGSSISPDLSPIRNELKAIGRVLSEQLARRGIGSEAAAVASDGQAAGAPRAAPGEFASREDVVRAIDKMCEFFQRTEPSSPVPLVLRRAQRLIAKDFMEILQDLAPDGVHQARFVGGITED